MSGRIITARHGRPNLARDLTISAREYGDWWARYDASGLHPDEAPPEALVALAGKAATVLSSTLPRAIETAREVTGGAREVPADPIFVEAPLPPPPVPWLKMRPGQWGVVSRAFWVLGYAPEGVESCAETWKRVDRIAERLEALAQGGDVLLCAHGFLNWMIDRRLRRGGWRRSAHDGGHHYWSWRVYEAEPSRELARTTPAIAE
ncbi:MAG: histidine phosphatase family protein [Pseudomonadota bacterium]|nr:histidine phosphatase family protein [Pseudomonadota bacterium]